MDQISRPLDFLNNCKGKKVEIITKENKKVNGTLLSFDIYINLVLKDAELVDDEFHEIKENIFIKGDDVCFVYQKGKKK